MGIFRFMVFIFVLKSYMQFHFKYALAEFFSNYWLYS